tara:strand:+ start:1471 stop:2364 length:894 start_codon:yes stop_codon:yes gene_type:complete
MALIDKKSTKTINEDSGKYTGTSKLINLGKGIENFTTPSLLDRTRPGLSDIKKTLDKPTGDIDKKPAFNKIDKIDTIKKPLIMKEPVDKGKLVKPLPNKKPINTESNLLNFPLPEINKRNLNQSVHLGTNGEIEPGYSRLDLVQDTEADFDTKTKMISTFTKPQMEEIKNLQKPTAVIDKNMKETTEKPLGNPKKDLEVGKNNLTTNFNTPKDDKIGKNNLTSDFNPLKPTIGGNNLTSDFNKSTIKIGGNNLTSDFNPLRPAIGQNNLGSNFSVPKNDIGTNNLTSDIDTSLKYKP